MSKKASTEHVEKRLGGGAWEAGYPLHGILQSKWQANSQVEGQALASRGSSVKMGDSSVKVLIGSIPPTCTKQSCWGNKA